MNIGSITSFFYCTKSTKLSPAKGVYYYALTQKHLRRGADISAGDPQELLIGTAVPARIVYSVTEVPDF